MKRKGIIMALALIATLTVGVGVALAVTTYQTKIVFLGNAGPSIKDQTLFGDLNSNSKCLGLRNLSLFKKTSTGNKLLDSDRSSAKGAWALRGNLTGSPDLLVKVRKAKRNHGAVVCKADSITLSAGKARYPKVR